MILNSINFEVASKLVRCTLQFRPVQDVSVQFEYVLQEHELVALSADWWEAEVKLLLSQKLGQEIL